MDNGEYIEGSTGREAGKRAASDQTPTMMDNIFRPAKDNGTGASTPIVNSTVEKGFPGPADGIPDDGPEVDVQVTQDSAPEPMWRRKWFVGVVAVLTGVALGAVVWGTSLDDTTEQVTPPLVATPEMTATVTVTVDTTATETARLRVTATETTQVRSTATQTLEIRSTATETVKVTADPAPTVMVTVTETVVRQNSEGLRREAAVSACTTAVEARLTSEYPEAEVDVPRGEALVAALRNDLDSWFIKLGTRLDGAEQIVDCYISASDGVPSVDSILVR